MKSYKLKIIIFLGIILAVFLLPKISWAADYYVAQSAAGSGNGTSCANAKTYNWNWKSPNVIAGDTVWICGTLTSQPSIFANGTSGHPITVKFCSEADCGVGNAGKISFAYPTIASFSIYGAAYVVLDGNSVGIIECTDNGTSKGNKVDTGNGVIVNVSNNIEIKNLTIQNLYVHDYGVEDYNSPETRAIYVIDSHHIKIHHNTVTNTGRGILIFNNGGVNPSNDEIYNNTISKACWAMGLGTAASAGNYINGTKIYNNDIEMGANWVGLSGCHLNGFYAWSNTTGSGYGVQNTQFYNNYFHGPSTNPGGTWISTGMLTGDGYGEMTDSQAYNNLFVMGGYVRTVGDPAVAQGAIGLGGDAQIYNNTIVDYRHSSPCIGLSNSSNQAIKNNILISCRTGVMFPNGSTNPTMTNNSYYDNTVDVRSTTNSYTLSQWQALGYDTNSISTNPDLNADYTEKSISPTKDVGTDLSSIFTTDKAGITRPQGSAWDIGAYEYVGAAPDTTPPAAPSGVTVN